MLGTVVAKRGVTIVMGPLHGLGSDQANKSKRIDRGVESSHADEYRDENFDSCVALLKNFHTCKNHANIRGCIDNFFLSKCLFLWSYVFKNMIRGGV